MNVIKKLGGTRALLAYGLTGAFIAACFVPGVSDAKFTSLGGMATMALAWYFQQKAAKDKVTE